MMYRANNKGGGRSVLHLLLTFVILTVVYSSGYGQAEEPAYRGIIDHFDWIPNMHFTMDEDGTISLGDTFTEGLYKIWFDPYGQIMIARDPESSAEDYLKWYRIDGDTFVKSSYEIHNKHENPVLWTDTPFRAIIGNYPIQVWQFDPATLDAFLLFEYYNENARGHYGTIVPDLHYIFYKAVYDYEFRRLNYNPDTGEIWGPVTTFSTPYRGMFDHTNTSDGRYIVALDNSSIMVHRIDDNGVPHTTSYYR